MTFKGRPPGPTAGHMSADTEHLRPAQELDKDTIAECRRMRRLGLSFAEIAAQWLDQHVTEAQVTDACQAMRTPKRDRSRRNLSVTLRAGAFIDSYSKPNEPVWSAVDRLIDEWQRGQNE